jgi:hypothetical protein
MGLRWGLTATTVGTRGAIILSGSIDVGEMEIMLMPPDFTEPRHPTGRGNHRQETPPPVGERIDVRPPPRGRRIRCPGRCS